MEEFRQGNCGSAIRGFRRLTFDLPPRDPRGAESRFYMAECHFQEHEFLEASRQFRRVSDESPSHPLAPAALLRAGDAFAELWKRPELDPTYGESALATYRELLARYPESEVAADGRERIVELNDKFAKKDYKTGEYYMRVRAYDSAILYFRSVVANYPQSSYASRSLIKLVEAYQKIGYRQEINETCSHLRRFYPDAEGIDDVCPAPADSPRS